MATRRSLRFLKHFKLLWWRIRECLKTFSRTNWDKACDESGTRWPQIQNGEYYGLSPYTYFILSSGRHIYPHIIIQDLHTHKLYLARLPGLTKHMTIWYTKWLVGVGSLPRMVSLNVFWTISLDTLFDDAHHCILLTNRFLRFLQKCTWFWSSVTQSLGDFCGARSSRRILCWRL